MPKSKTNKLKDGRFKFHPFYISLVNYNKLKQLKAKFKVNSFNDLFTILITQK